MSGCQDASKDRLLEWKEVISGVLQGSVLGPLFFTIFVDSIKSDVNSKFMKLSYVIKVVRVIEAS